MTNTLPPCTELPRRVKRPLTQAQKDGDACRLCESNFDPARDGGDRIPFGDGFRCEDMVTCADVRGKLYAKSQAVPLKASGDVHASHPEEGHDVG